MNSGPNSGRDAGERELRAAFDHAANAQPVAPADTALAADLRRGRKALLRQRFGVAAATMCGVAVVAVAAYGGSGLLAGDGPRDVAGGPNPGPIPSPTSTPKPAPTPTPATVPALGDQLPPCAPFAWSEAFGAYFTPLVTEQLRQGNLQQGNATELGDPRCDRTGHQVEYVDQYLTGNKNGVMNTVGVGVFGPGSDEDRLVWDSPPDDQPCALGPQIYASKPLSWDDCRTRELPEGRLRIGVASDNNQIARGMTLFRDDGYVVSVVVSTLSRRPVRADIPLTPSQIREIVLDPRLVQPPVDR